MKLVTWLKQGDIAAVGALTGDDEIVDLKASAVLFETDDEPPAPVKRAKDAA